MIGDLEMIADSVYCDAGLTTERPAEPIELAERILGEGSVRFVPCHALPGRGAVARVRGRWGIFVVAQTPEPVRRFIVLHELAHVVLGKGATEQQCDSLAAALLAPRQAFLSALREHGDRLPALARTFGTSQSCVGLRLGEVTAQPTALVCPGSVKIRGASYCWPSEPNLRELAQRQRIPGLRKARLSDDRSRAVLRAF